MENTQIINRFGKVAGWNSISVNIMGRELEGIQELSYSDEKDLENVYGAGAFPVGQGDGNYTCKATLSLLNEERLALLESLPRGKRLQDLTFDMTVVYEYNDRVYTDVVKNCRFMNHGVEVKQGDKSIVVKYDLLPSHILFNKK